MIEPVFCMCVGGVRCREIKGSKLRSVLRDWGKSRLGVEEEDQNSQDRI